MRLTRMLFSRLAIAICVILGAANAAAQTYWVQSADYGWNNRRQDVTNRVRRLVNGPNFKVNNNTMGVDPAVGKDKVLRIIGRMQNGTVRTFTYQEGQMVNAQMFAGNWGGGGGGGMRPPVAEPLLRISTASYIPVQGGAGANVTERLQLMVVNNRLDIVVNNQTMGVDPAPGRPKKLNVVYQYNGQVNTISVGQNSRLRIP